MCRLVISLGMAVVCVRDRGERAQQTRAAFLSGVKQYVHLLLLAVLLICFFNPTMAE